MIVKNIKRYRTQNAGFSAMGMDWAAQQKKQELEMTKKSEGEPDLGYVGAFSGMKCGNLNEVGDRLECHHSKWKYDDPLAKMEVRRKALQRKRQGRHKFAIQRMCMEESPMLCAIKDRDDIPKEKEPKCLEVKACPEPHTQLSDILDDTKDFYKMIIKAMAFSQGKKSKRKKNTKELSKLRKKMKKELEQIKKDYDSLKKPGAGAPPAKGGAMPQLDPNMANKIFRELSSSTTPIDYGMNGGAENKPKGTIDKVKDVIKAPFKNVEFSNATGTTGCKGFVGKGVFADDWKKYKSCVLDMMDGAPKDGVAVIEGAKAKFKQAPLVEQHLQLLEKYKRKKDLMEKTASSASQKLKQLKKKADGKMAAYKVAGQKAKDGAKKLTNYSKRDTKKNMNKLEGNKGLKDKAEGIAKEKVNKKLADINKKRQDGGLPPLSPKDTKAFTDKQTGKEMKKIVSSRSALKTMKKDIMRNEIKQKATTLGIGDTPLKTSKKTLKKLEAAQGKIDKMAQLKGANGNPIGKAKAKAMVMGGLSAKQGKTRAERKLAKAKLGPMATSMKSAKKLSKAQNKIKEKLDAAKESGASKTQLKAMEQGMRARASTSFLQRKITKRGQFKEATKGERQVKRDMKTNEMIEKAGKKNTFGKGAIAADRKRLLGEKTGDIEKLKQKLKKANPEERIRLQAQLKSAQKNVQSYIKTTKKTATSERRKEKVKSGLKTLGKGLYRTGAAAVTAGQSEKAGRKAFGRAASVATLGFSRLGQRLSQGAEKAIRKKLGFSTNKVNRKIASSSIINKYTTAGSAVGRGALTAGSALVAMPSAAKRATGRALSGTLAAGRAATGAAGRGTLAAGRAALTAGSAVGSAFVAMPSAAKRAAGRALSGTLAAGRAATGAAGRGTLTSLKALAGTFGLTTKGRQAYATAGKGLLRTTKAAATLGGTEIYRRSEIGQRSKLDQRQLKQMRNKAKLDKTFNKILSRGVTPAGKKAEKKAEKKRSKLYNKIEARKNKIQKTQGQLNNRTKKKIAKSQAIANKLVSKQNKATANIKTYGEITKTQRAARNKRTGTREAKTAKNSEEMDALQKQVNQQKINGQKSANQQANTQKRAKKLMAARRAGSKESSSKILGDKPSNIVQPKKKTRTQKVISGFKKMGRKLAGRSKNKTATTASSNGTKMTNAEMLMASTSTSTSASAVSTNAVVTNGATASANGVATNGVATNASEVVANAVATNGATANTVAASGAAPNASEVVAVTSPENAVVANAAKAAVASPAPTSPAVANGTASQAPTSPAPTSPAVASPAVANAVAINEAATNASGAVANPAAANPAVANPAVANPAVAKPEGTNANAAVANPAVAKPEGTNANAAVISGAATSVLG